MFRGWSQASLAEAYAVADLSSGLHCFGPGDWQWVGYLTESVMGHFCKKWHDFRRRFIAEKSEKTQIIFLSLRAVWDYLYTFYWPPLILVFFWEACSKEYCREGWISVRSRKVQPRGLSMDLAVKRLFSFHHVWFHFLGERWKLCRVTELFPYTKCFQLFLVGAHGLAVLLM